MIYMLAPTTSKSTTQRIICKCFSAMGSLPLVCIVLFCNIVGDLGGGSGNSSMTNTAASLLHRLLITLIPQMFPSPPICINIISFLFQDFFGHKGGFPYNLYYKTLSDRPPNPRKLCQIFVVKLVLTPPPFSWGHCS